MPHHGARHGAASRITRVDDHVGRVHNAQRSKHMSRWTRLRNNRQDKPREFSISLQTGRSCSAHKAVRSAGARAQSTRRAHMREGAAISRGADKPDMICCCLFKLRGEVSSSGSFDSISFNCHHIKYFERVPPHWLKRMLHDHPVVNDFRLAKQIDRLKKYYSNPLAFETLAWQTRIKPFMQFVLVTNPPPTPSPKLSEDCHP